MSKKKKVLLVTRSFLPIYQGDSVNYSILAKGLDKEQNLSMIVLTSYLHDSKLIEKYNKCKVYRLLATRSSIHYDSPISAFNRYFFYLTAQVSLFILIPLFVILFRINIIHFQPNIVVLRYGKYQNWILQALMRVLPCKVILDARHIWSMPKKDWPFDKIIYNSGEIYSRLMDRGFSREKLVYIPSGIFISNQNYHSRNAPLLDLLERYRPYICFIGRVCAEKGIYTLLDGLNHLSESFSKYHLIIAGPNADGVSFRNVIKENQRVVYLGMIAHSNALDVIRLSEVLVLPSKAEGVPRVCLEAILMGKKIVGPPGIKEFEAHCPEFVLEKITPVDTARKIEEVVLGNKTPKYPPLEAMTKDMYVQRMKKLYWSMSKV